MEDCRLFEQSQTDVSDFVPYTRDRWGRKTYMTLSEQVSQWCSSTIHDVRVR